MKKMFILLSILSVCSMKPAYSYNPLHLKIFMKGANGRNLDYWDKWRKAHPGIRPDLSGAVIDISRDTGNPSFYFSNFSYVNFRHTKISNGFLNGVYLNYSDLSYSTLQNLSVLMLYVYGARKSVFFSVKNSNLTGACIRECYFKLSSFINVRFYKAKIENSKFEYSSFRNVSFEKAKIINSKFFAPIIHANFSGATIIKSRVGRERMVNVNFSNTIFKECILSATFINATFVNANLSGTKFSSKDDGNIELVNVNFTNANLTNTDFSSRYPYGKNTFKKVIFKNADMKGAKVNRKWYNYIKRQGVRNFDKIIWVG